MKALLLIDLINDMVSSEGKLAEKGYAAFADVNATAASVAAWRAKDIFRVMHVGLEFRRDYSEKPRNSLLLGRVADFGVATSGSFGSQFVEWASPQGQDIVIRKKRMSPFFGTDLELTLRALMIEDIVIGGVATDLAVSSTARDAHDRDFRVSVAKDICVAASEDDQRSAFSHIGKFARLVTQDEWS